MKIKVFKFEVSNPTSSPCSDDYKFEWFQEKKDSLYTPAQVEDIVNNFCKDKSIFDIKVNNVDVQYHNNARGNTIELWYTIIYKEVK